MLFLDFIFSLLVGFINFDAFLLPQYNELPIKSQLPTGGDWVAWSQSLGHK